MWSAAGRLLEVEGPREWISPENGGAAYRTAAAAIESERGRLLSAVGSTVNAVLASSLGSAEGDSDETHCDSPVVRDMCIAVEASLEHHLLPPLFSLGHATLSYALVQLVHARRHSRHSGDLRHPLRFPAEAVALARGLGEKHLSLSAPYAPAGVRDAYAARLWICLALQRGVLHTWVATLADALPQSYAAGSLLTTADERSMLVDLLAPLAHVSFALPLDAPRQLSAFLGLPPCAEAEHTFGGHAFDANSELWPEEAAGVADAVGASGGSEDAESAHHSDEHADHEQLDHGKAPDPPMTPATTATSAPSDTADEDSPSAASATESVASASSESRASAPEVAAGAPAASPIDGSRESKPPPESTPRQVAVTAPLRMAPILDADAPLVMSPAAADAKGAAVRAAAAAAADALLAQAVADSKSPEGSSHSVWAASATDMVDPSEYLDEPQQAAVTEEPVAVADGGAVQQQPEAQRAEAEEVDVSAAAELAAEAAAEEEDDEEMFGSCARVDRLPLFARADAADETGGEEAPALLRRVSPRRGDHLYLGVSGLLSRHEGDMAMSTQRMQLASCWAAAAAFFGEGDWWALSWGGRPLSDLASTLQRVSLERERGGAGADGADGVDGSSEKVAESSGLISNILESSATIANALTLHGPWRECYAAAKEAGAALAHALRTRSLGRRPVSLIAISLGARVVWQCLEVLAALPEEEGRGLVHDVLLFAAPVTNNPARWERVGRHVITGRLINAYVPGDSQLGALYRLDHLASKGCCGLEPVDSPRVESYDATAHVAGDSHSYHFALPAVCDAVALLPSP